MEPILTRLPAEVKRRVGIIESIPPVPIPPERFVYPLKPAYGCKILSNELPKIKLSAEKPPPTTWSFAAGVVVPIPTFPPVVARYADSVEVI